MLEQPIATQPHYGEHLGDAFYWGPYLAEVARRERIAVTNVEAPFVGSFPTFLIGDFVVKLFGPGFDGKDAWSAERSMHELLASRPELPVPALVAAGALFDASEPWSWPYLVTERLHGHAVRERALEGAAGMAIAQRLGEAVAVLHTLPPPQEVDEREVVTRLRDEAPSRLARFGLPPHLVEQVPDFLSDALAPTTLVPADITEDHLFHDGKNMIGIIDWGDAIVADRWYELVPLAFGCFDADRQLLDAFLNGYGWVVDADFPKRAMQAVCEFQFDAITRIAELVDIRAVSSLDALAEELFG